MPWSDLFDYASGGGISLNFFSFAICFFIRNNHSFAHSPHGTVQFLEAFICRLASDISNEKASHEPNGKISSYYTPGAFLDLMLRFRGLIIILRRVSV